MIILIIIIVTVVLWYFYKKTFKPKDEPSTFAADTPELLDPNTVIILHNSTDKMLYITASTKGKSGELQPATIGIPILTTKSAQVVLYNKQELNPDEFISISGILDKNVGISIYSDEKELIKTLKDRMEKDGEVKKELDKQYEKLSKEYQILLDNYKSMIHEIREKSYEIELKSK